MSRPVIPLEEVLVAFARALQFEAEGHGAYFPMREQYWFLPKTSGYDVRYPTLAIAKYAHLFHGTIVGKVEDVEEEFKAAHTTEEDEVFLPIETELVDERYKFETKKVVKIRLERVKIGMKLKIVLKFKNEKLV